MASKRVRLAQRRRAMGMTQEQLAAAVGMGTDRSTIYRWESGEITPPPRKQPRLARALGVSPAELIDLLMPVSESYAPTKSGRVVHVGSSNALDRAELVRREITDSISNVTVTESGIDDWEQAVRRYGDAARGQPASVLLADLTIDLDLLKQTMSRCRSSSALRRLTRVVALMSGLMCLTLIKLDERSAFRGWAHTARVAADESEDPVTRSWVLAQEAYGHYYSGNLAQAEHVARHSQDIAGAELSVGAVLAAALESRVHAVHGRSAETRAALGHAEIILEKLPPTSVNVSAFGYNEAQFRFHQGNAFTHLHDTRLSWKAQERALELCDPGDYMDQALTRLDRASCLLHDGDVTTAAGYAIDTLLNLDDQQRRGIITVRAEELLRSLPRQQRALQPVRELRELLTIISGAKE